MKNYNFTKVLIAFLVISFSAFSKNNTKGNFKIPYQKGDYYHIYLPKGDTFPGPNTQHLRAGKIYDKWSPNDHCLIKGNDGLWHMFGITHPLTPLEYVHDGENQSFHAVSQKKKFKSCLRKDLWLDKAKVLTPKDRPGEILANHSPYIVKKDDLFYMVYGHSPIRLATSSDLYKWEPKGSVFEEKKGARDPNLILHDGVYYISYCSEKKVLMRSSKDLYNWSEPKIIYETNEFDPESPSLIFKDGYFYLFVCSWDGINHTNDVKGAYQYNTYVYISDSLESFDSKKCIGMLKAHAPEIFQDEKGKWYVSSAEYPYRGVSVCKLDWK